MTGMPNIMVGSCMRTQLTDVMVPATGAPTRRPMPRCLYTHGVPWALL